MTNYIVRYKNVNNPRSKIRMELVSQSYLHKQHNFESQSRSIRSVFEANKGTLPDAGNHKSLKSLNNSECSSNLNSISTKVKPSDFECSSIKRKKVKKTIPRNKVSENYVKLDLRRNFRRNIKKKVSLNKRRSYELAKREGLDENINISDIDEYCSGVEGNLFLDRFRLPEEQIDPEVWQEAGMNVGLSQGLLNLWEKTDSSGETFSEPQHKSVPADEPRGVETDLHYEEALHHLFGFQSFRPGQKQVIKRVMNFVSTLLVQPTGAGKSLCYQLPAYLHHLANGSIAVVVCPLLSLMDDQLKRLPRLLSGCTLNSTQSKAEERKVIEELYAGKHQVLFVSPELACSEKFISLARSATFSPISFVCVDEAHCVSEWSHNFRPSYCRLGAVLREQLQVRCVLALTATATARTLYSISSSFQIQTSNVVRGLMIPRNLLLTISTETNKLRALKEWLLLPCLHYNGRLGSCIVYCTRREQTEEVALFLRNNEVDAWAYHAGLTPLRRRTLQHKFMSGVIRVVVATIAFGMGLNKSDIRGVVHFHIPKSLENYVQEIGRAGRDGAPAYCHLFYSPEDRIWLESRVYSDAVDSTTLESFVEKVFFMDRTLTEPHEHLVLLPVEAVSHSLDLEEAAVYTLLTKLEFSVGQYITLLANHHCVCVLRGPLTSARLHDDRSEAALFIKTVMRTGGGATFLSFDVYEKAVQLKLSVVAFRENLVSACKQCKISCEFKERAWCYRINKRPTPSEAKEIAAKLLESIQHLELEQLRKLQYICRLAEKYAVEGFSRLYDKDQENLRQKVDEGVRVDVLDYFQEPTGDTKVIPADLQSCTEAGIESARVEARALLVMNRQIRSGNACAKIMHGISTPRFPGKYWSKHRSWRAFLQVNFVNLSRIAEEELAALRAAQSFL
ncbi:uncharacterized protein LOC135145786 isoform X3 [Zophobas morio]|uniref:uncharacterized protein LOC135145786 isoform X3 n=1 Tax=Zophobas morio TaxID=2755281 RepID=UPI00308309EC